MAMTNAEKQRRYRERALRCHADEGGLLLSRLQTYLTPQAAAKLERLRKHTGKSQKDIINQAIIELAEREGCYFD